MKHDYDSEENKLWDLRLIRDNQYRQLNLTLAKLIGFTYGRF